MRLISLIGIFLFVFLQTPKVIGEERLCIENVCIGDNADTLNVEWKSVKIDYKTKRSISAQLKAHTVEETYYDYNELLITDQKNLIELAPYIITLQKFDNDVLDKLAKVKAICTPLSLTGEVENSSRTKLLVTFKAVADEGGRGLLRVVQVEKEFNIYPPHLRPQDKEKYVAMIEALKRSYPNTVVVRDIDARAMSNEVAFANSIVGFRFFSDVYTPLIFRIRDLADLESIDLDPKRSALCPMEG